MTLAILGTVGVPARYGGFETLVENLLDADLDRVAVYCSASHYPERLKTYKGARLHYIRLNANGVQSIFYDAFCLIHALVNGYRNILVLGVSGGLAIPFARWLRPEINIITNIDGAEWKRSKWGPLASWFLRQSEAAAVCWSSVVVADNQVIADHVRNVYDKDCVVIAYGGDHAPSRAVSESRFTEPYSLALCRIEPENNVEMILQAFSRGSMAVKFIGNWGNSVYGKRLKQEYAAFPNIELIDPIYDLDSLGEYRANCAFYVHGHSAGGTNPSLVEAMHFGKPVLAFDCDYNRATMEDKGAYFGSAEELTDLIQRRDVWDESGAELREIAQRRYTWRIVTEQYLSLLK